MSAFSLCPPKLLIISNVKQYYQMFKIEKFSMSPTVLVAQFLSDRSLPWFDCFGNCVRLRYAALSKFEKEIASNINYLDALDIERHIFISRLLKNESERKWLAEPDESSLLPEIVFRSVPSRDELNFLISFSLRFDHFDTELELMRTDKLIDRFIYAQLLQQKITYISR